MKKFIVAVSIVVSLFVCTSCLFAYQKPIYVPYVDFNQLKWSKFYSLTNVKKRNVNFDEYLSEHSNVRDLIDRLLKKPEKEFEKRYSTYFKDMRDKKVQVELSFQNYSSIIITGSLNGKRRCLLVKMVDNEGLYLVDKGLSDAHYFAAAIANECNLKAGINLHYSSYFDYMFYDVLSCLGRCQKHNSIVFESNLDHEDKNQGVRSLENSLITWLIIFVFFQVT